MTDNTPESLSNSDAVNTELSGDVFAAQSNLARRVTNSKLSALRAQNPFVSIVPFPNTTIAVLLAAGVATDINIPEGTKYISIRSTSEYFVSRNGNARLPTALPSSDSGACSFDSAGFIYVEEIKQLSIISTAANNSVCFACYQQL